MKDYLKLKTDSDDKGYGQFSRTHMLLLGMWILFIAAYCIVYSHFDVKARNDMRTAAAITLLVSDVIKMAVIYFTHQDVIDHLPCEICSFAAYTIAADAFLPGNSFIQGLLVAIFLPAAIIALIFPTTTRLPVFNFFTFHQYFYHALIASYILGRFFAREIFITYPRLLKSILATLCLVSVMYLINRNFNRNFMFLVGDDNNPLLKKINDRSGGFRYTLVLVGFAIAVLHVFFGVLKLLELLIRA